MTSDNSSNGDVVKSFEMQEGAPPYEILQFLAENAEQVFTQSEIHDATTIERDVLSTVLRSLKDRSLVRQEGRYWSIGEDDRLASYAAQMNASSVSVTDDYYGEG